MPHIPSLLILLRNKGFECEWNITNRGREGRVHIQTRYLGLMPIQGLKLLIKTLVLEAAYNAELLKRMGYKYLGRNHRVGSDTFIHAKDDNDPEYHQGLQAQINQNLDKKDTLRDPPAVGISLPKSLKG